MLQRRKAREGTTARPESGFTLLEVLTALIVIGVAINIFLTLFSGSITIADANKAEKAGAAVAEEALSQILAHPSAYVWPAAEDAPYGDLQLLQREDTSGEGRYKAEPPAAMPTTERAYNRDRELYYDFIWEAHARYPSANAKHVEVVVIVSWTQDGREQLFTLTSAIARPAIEGHAE